MSLRVFTCYKSNKLSLDILSYDLSLKKFKKFKFNKLKFTDLENLIDMYYKMS